MKHIVTDTVHAAAGHWPQLLPARGISINATGQHSPCPVCGGKDRFRFDNQAGRGTWVCNQCGAGDGLALVEKALDVNTKEAACRVAGLIGELPVKPVQTSTEKTYKEKARARLNAAKEAARLVAGAAAQAGSAYLSGKGLAETPVMTLTASKRISDISPATCLCR